MAANISKSYSIDPKFITGHRMPNVYINRITLQTINIPDNSKKNRINAHALSPEQTRTNTPEKEPNLRVVLDLEIKDVKTGKYSKWFLNRRSKKILEKIQIAVIQTTKPEATKLWSEATNIEELLTGDNYQKATDGTDIQTLSIKEFLNVEDPRTVFNLQDPEIDDLGIRVYNFNTTVSFPSNLSKNSAGFSSKLAVRQKHLAYFVYSFIPESNMVGKINSDIVLNNGQIVSEAYVMTRQDNGQIWTGPFHKHAGDIKVGGQPYFGFMGGDTHNRNDTQPLLNQIRVKSDKVQDFRSLASIKKIPIEYSLLEKQLLEQTLNIQKVDTNIIQYKRSIFSKIYLSRDLNTNCRFIFSIDLKKLIRGDALLGNILSNDDQTINELLNFITVKSLKIFRKRLKGSPKIGSRTYEFPLDKHFQPYEKPVKFTGDSTVQTGDIVEDFIITGGTYAKEFKKRYMIDRSRELIIVATQEGNRIAHSPSTGDGVSTLKEISFVYHEEDQDTQGVKYLTGTDNSVSNMTDGYYQYEAEVMLENNIADYLNQQRSILSNDLEQLKKIINVAGSKTINELNTTSSPVPVTERNYRLDGSKPAFYNPALKIFTDGFIKALADGEILSDIDSNFWQKFPLDYQAAILKLAQINLNAEQREALLGSMRSFLNPISSNLESFIEISSMFESLIGIYGSAISLYEKSQNHKDERDENSKSKVESSDPKLTNYLTAHYTFTDIFDASIPHNFGNLFFNFDKNNINFNEIGLRTIQNEDYEKYRDDEAKKLFTGPDVDLSISNFPAANGSIDLTSYGFFTPSIFFMGNNDPSYVVDPNTDIKKYDNTLIDKLKFDNRQTQESLPGPQGNKNDESNKMADFFAENFGITAVLNNEPTTPSIPPGRQPPNNLQDRPLNECGTQNTVETSAPMVGSIGDQNEQWRKSSPIFKAMLLTGITIPQQKPQGEFPVGTTRRIGIGNLSPQVLAGDQDIDDSYIQSLPNQIKALIVAQDTNQEDSFSPQPSLNQETDQFLKTDPFGNIDTFMKAKFLFEIITHLEVLTGYETVKFKSGLERSVKAPVWKTLTKDIFQRAQSGGRILMCRLTPYINERLKFVYNEEENLPILDQYFFIGNVTNQETSSPLGPVAVPDPLSIGLSKPSFQSTNFEMSATPATPGAQQARVRTFGNQTRTTQSPTTSGPRSGNTTGGKPY
jgi:hypothetical protein